MIEADPQDGARLTLRFVLGAFGLVLAAYTITLIVARDEGLWIGLAGGLANAVPTAVFGIGAYLLIARQLVGRPALRQAAGHVLVGAGFCLLTYWLTIVLLGAFGAMSPVEFDVRPFIRRAAAWQTLQNATVYALIATIAHLRARPAVAVILSGGPAAAATEDSKPALSRYFIRDGDELLPIDVDTIVSISGADDYAEVATTEGRHLVRMTLAELEQSLDPARFIRVHRSRIVNVGRIARAEPAGGGRLLLHMEDGETIAASRTGSKRLRDRVL
jgi:DNA-binding LytR/AlgR family response regulator